MNLDIDSSKRLGVGSNFCRGFGTAKNHKLRHKLAHLIAFDGFWVLVSPRMRFGATPFSYSDFNQNEGQNPENTSFLDYPLVF